MATIKQNNAAFTRMSKADKRVAIAKDALAQITAKKYTAKSGVYVILNSKSTLGVLCDKTMQVRDVMNIGSGCQTCARGALFLSANRKFNNVTVGELVENGGWGGCADSTACELTEQQHFNTRQIALIEAAFEQWSDDVAGINHDFKVFRSKAQEAACLAFGKRWPKAKDRLRAILCNIIANGGTFKP